MWPTGRRHHRRRRHGQHESRGVRQKRGVTPTGFTASRARKARTCCSPPTRASFRCRCSALTCRSSAALPCPAIPWPCRFTRWTGRFTSRSRTRRYAALTWTALRSSRRSRPCASPIRPASGGIEFNRLWIHSPGHEERRHKFPFALRAPGRTGAAHRRCASPPVGPLAGPLSLAAGVVRFGGLLPRQLPADLPEFPGVRLPGRGGVCEVIATVHVEAERSRLEQVAETAWLHDVHARHGFPNAVVAHAWFDRQDSEECLFAQSRFRWCAASAVNRSPLLPPTKAPKDKQAPCRTKPGCAAFHCLKNMACDGTWRVPAWHLPEAAAVAALFPKVPIALNHHGFAWDRSEEGIKRWRGWMETLARQENVHVKLSEFGLRDRPWDRQENARIVYETIAIFGCSAACLPATFRWRPAHKLSGPR
jgi:predicted TIM-barrel fold metal-dependent hydrolase